MKKVFVLYSIYPRKKEKIPVFIQEKKKKFQYLSKKKKEFSKKESVYTESKKSRKMVISKKFFRLRKNIKVRKGSMRKKFCSLKNVKYYLQDMQFTKKI